MKKKNKKKAKRSAPSKKKSDPIQTEAANKKLLEEHIPYEAAMLNGTFDLLQQGIQDKITRNAIIESYCTHCRSLIDFMRGKGSVRASDFTTGFDSKAVCKDKKYTQLISDQIAHLSQNRTAKEDDKIGPALWLAMYEDISEHFLKFIEAIREPYEWKSEWTPLVNLRLPPGGANNVPQHSTGPTGPTHR